MQTNPERKQTLRQTLQSTKHMMGSVWREREGKAFILVRCILALKNALFPLVFILFPGLMIGELFSGDPRVYRLVLFIGV